MTAAPDPDPRPSGAPLARMGFGPGGAVRVTHPARAAFLADLQARLAARTGFAVATINLDHAVKLRRDAAFRAAYLAQTHVVADGNPIVWLSRLAGEDADLIPGSELVAPLCAMAARIGVRVALVGSTRESLEAAARRLQADHAGLAVPARIAPPFGFDPDGPEVPGIAETLREKDVGLCFLALGAPKQERLAMRLADAAPRCGFASIGAGVDFVAGTQTRAPALVRRMAMEWLWRLAGDPGRLAARYGACAAILPGLAVRALRARLRGPGDRG